MACSSTSSRRAAPLRLKRRPPSSNKTPNSMLMAAIGMATAQPKACAGQIDCKMSHAARAAAIPKTNTEMPAMDAAVPPQRDGFPARARFGPPSKKRGAPHAAHRESSPWSTIGARCPHAGQEVSKGEPIRLALAYCRTDRDATGLRRRRPPTIRAANETTTASPGTFPPEPGTLHPHPFPAVPPLGFS